MFFPIHMTLQNANSILLVWPNPAKRMTCSKHKKSVHSLFSNHWRKYEWKFMSNVHTFATHFHRSLFYPQYELVHVSGKETGSRTSFHRSGTDKVVNEHLGVSSTHPTIWIIRRNAAFDWRHDMHVRKYFSNHYDSPKIVKFWPGGSGMSAHAWSFFVPTAYECKKLKLILLYEVGFVCSHNLVVYQLLNLLS